MRSSKTQVRRKFHAIPTVEFSADYGITSFAGLAIFQRLFQALRLRARLKACFPGEKLGTVFGPGLVMLLLVVHILLGFRRLSEVRFYRHDRLVQRLLGLEQLPDKSTLSRTLAALPEAGVKAVRGLMGDLVLERLPCLSLERVSLDFDGTVQSTVGHAEGTAVGYNPTKKGARGYYPLLCSVAQTGQFFDCLHRPGNVHDSRDALAFMQTCIRRVSTALPKVPIELRMDSAFFDRTIVDALDEAGVTFTASVPFERFTVLKQLVEDSNVADWQVVDEDWSVLDTHWSPKSWGDDYRIVIARQIKVVRQKEPLQLDLFVPRDFEFEYTVVLTNRMDATAAEVLLAHHGRAAQERVIGEAKQNAALGVIVARKRVANEAFTLAGLLAHNLVRELQIGSVPPSRQDGVQRSTFWRFKSLRTLRNQLLRRAGVLVRPGGRFTLRVANEPGLPEAFDTFSSYAA